MIRLILEAVKEWVEETLISFRAMYLGYVTPQMYGAKADGVTDDSTAIVNAISRVITNGNTLYLPEGTYLIDWGRVSASVGTIGANGLNIIGDGKYKSIIKLKDTHNDGNYGNGLAFVQYNNSIYPNFSMRNLGLVYDNNDDSITTFPSESYLIRMWGQFGEIVFDNVYWHIGGTATTLPHDTCLFPHVGAKSFTISNCLFENFTNNTVGGCVWITPWWDDTHSHEIEQINICNNEFRNTNRDEAIGLFVLSSDTEGQIKNIRVAENTIIHKNWNGDCHFCNGLIAIYQNSTSSTEYNNVIVSDNEIYSANMWQEVIRTNYLKNVHISNNKIAVDSIDESQTGIAMMVNILNGEGTVVDNIMDYSKVLSNSGISQNNSKVIWDSNIITSNKNFYVQPYNSKSILTLCNNIINILTDSSMCVIRSAGNKEYIYDNIVNGQIGLGTITGTNTFIKGNKFNHQTNGNNKLVINASSLDFESNTGATIILNDTVITTPMASFKFVGLKSQLKFVKNGVNVDDSSAVRATFFVNDDVTYIDPSLADITDIELTTPQSGDVLVYDGGKWENRSIDGIDPTDIDFSDIEGV